MVTRARLDAELVRRGLARSRGQAAELIDQGRVAIRGITAEKAATVVDRDTPVTVVATAERQWASRGAHKLIGALPECLERRRIGRLVGELSIGSSHRIAGAYSANRRQHTHKECGGASDLYYPLHLQTIPPKILDLTYKLKSMGNLCAAYGI